MKATEVYINKLIKKKVAETVRLQSSPFLSPPPPQNVEENIVGVKTNPGHELHRIRNRMNSRLWDKIKNWD